MMKAAVQHEYGDPRDVVGPEDVAVPSVSGAEVLVEVHAAGVNWADWSMTMGMPYIMRLGYGLKAPRKGVRGTDVAGVVVDVGPDVTEFSLGDQVFGWCTGAFAEFVVVDEGQLQAQWDFIRRGGESAHGGMCCTSGGPRHRTCPSRRSCPRRRCLRRDR